MDEKTAQYYETNATTVADRFEAVDGGVSRLFPVLFRAEDRVLDVGAGSGRDLAELIRIGCDGCGVEPSQKLRERAVQLHPELSGRLFAGTLPNLFGAAQVGTTTRNTSCALAADKFDAVLLSAVLMHIPDADLFDSAIALRSLVREGGRLVVSVATSRGDIIAGTDRDKHGKLLVIRSAGQVQLLFERIGFRLESLYESADAAGRPGVEWATLVFVYAGSAPRPIDRIESIINRDRKTSTYKLALLRALSDIATTCPGLARDEPASRVSIPLDSVAELWVRYYWPIVADPRSIRQNWNSRGPVRFRRALEEMIASYASLNGLVAYVAHVRSGRLPTDLAKQQRELLAMVRGAIVYGPVAHAGDREFATADNRILVHRDLWRELVLMGHWISDSILLRWAELTSNRSDGSFRASEIVDLLLQSVEDQRMDLAVRDLYAAHCPLECTWTGATLTHRFDVDHIIPFALRKDSSIWNLVPASASVNASKKDHLPTIETVRAASERIVADWRLLREWDPVRFQSDAARLSASSAELASPTGRGEDWEKPLLNALIETIEYTATVRGVERWAG